VDIFSMGVILFVMVTGTLPFISEASLSDPLYKLIFLKKKAEFWECWRELKVEEDDSDEEGCLTRKKNSCSRIFTFMSGEKESDKDFCSQDTTPKSKRAYSEEFKDLVFTLMSYNYYDRLTIKQIKAHPWL